MPERKRAFSCDIFPYLLYLRRKINISIEKNQCSWLGLTPWCPGVSSCAALAPHQPLNIPPVISHLPSGSTPGCKHNFVQERGGGGSIVIQYHLFVRLLLYCKVCLVLQCIAMIHKLLCNWMTMINLSYHDMLVTKFNFFPQLSFSVVQMQPLEPFHVLQSEDPQVAPNMWISSYVSNIVPGKQLQPGWVFCESSTATPSIYSLSIPASRPAPILPIWSQVSLFLIANSSKL